MKKDRIPVILGPTASGKTGVGVRVAKKLGGEIISADSRAIFKGMDIGTAKPSSEERGGILHWGIDLVDPDERFTVADWQQYCLAKIDEIRGRGKLPVIVGGTGLYIDSIVYDYQFTEGAKQSQDDRREMNKNFILYGIRWDSEQLRERIATRTNNIFNDKLYAETKNLQAMYNFDLPSMKSNVYKIVADYLAGEINLDRAKELNNFADYHLAKRQMTWFKRNPEINWLPLTKIEQKIITDFSN